MTGDWREIFSSAWDILNDPGTDLNEQREELTEAFWKLQKQNEERETLIRNLGSIKQSNQLVITNRLHDGPLQNLSAAIQIFQQNMKLSSTPEALRTQGQILVSQINAELSNIRDILLNSALLLPSEQRDLKTQLRETIRTRQAGVAISLEIEESALEDVSPEMGYVIIHFVQETMRNAQRHGNATELKVLVTKYQDMIVLQTIDNGVGFAEVPPITASDFQQLADSGHIGLCMLAELVIPFQGQFNFVAKGSELGGAKVELKLQL